MAEIERKIVGIPEILVHSPWRYPCPVSLRPAFRNGCCVHELLEKLLPVLKVETADDVSVAIEFETEQVDTRAITSHFAIPLLIKTPGGLVVEVTDGTDEYNATNYRVSFFYDLAKASVNRMAFALAHELRRTARRPCRSLRVGCGQSSCSRSSASPKRTGVRRQRACRTSLFRRVQRSSAGP